MASNYYSPDDAADKLGISREELESKIDMGELSMNAEGLVRIDEPGDDDIAFSDMDELDIGFADDDQQKSGSSGFGSGFGSQSVNVLEGDADDDPTASTRVMDGDSDLMSLDTGSDLVSNEGVGEGQNVFKDDEVVASDPAAQTRMTTASSSDSWTTADDDDDDDLVLEAVGSGSGLLDLTRESDDTSLGAELLEEIYPTGNTEAGQTGFSTGFGTGVGPAASAASGSMSAGSMTAGGFADMFGEDQSGGANASMFGQSEQSEIMVEASGAVSGGEVITVPFQPDQVTLPSALMIIGFLLPAGAGLVMATILVVNMIMVIPRRMELLDNMQQNFMVYLIAMGGASLVFGVAGYIIGRQLTK